MRVGIIQSSFIPWRGYFDFIASVDLFVFLEDVQFSKGSWRNRNRIKGQDGTHWLTVPVRHRSLSQLIIETEIDDRQDWRANHFKQWHIDYASATFLPDVLALLEDLGKGSDMTISQLNIRLIRAICAYLDIHTPLIQSSELNIEGIKTDRLINMLRAVGGDTYLSGSSADAYLEKHKFIDAGIKLEYKSYDYEPYPQLWGDFEGSVSVLDLIANCGQQSRKLIRSTITDLVVIS